MPKYLTYMQKFSYSELDSFIGKEIIESLSEWIPTETLTKSRRASMILSLHGTKIFKEREFRKALLRRMPTEEIEEIRDACLTGKEKKEKDIQIVLETIAKKPWANNHISQVLLDHWEVDPSILSVPTIVEETVATISSGERFFELLDYQFYIKQRALNYLNSGNLLERMFIHMPTGTGKTKTTMHIVTNYYEFSLKKKGLIIWVAHTKELLNQAYNTFKQVWEHLGDDEINMYRIWGNHSIEDIDREIDGIAFCGLAKLVTLYDNNKSLFERIKKDCRLVVFDEAHMAAAPKTREVIESLMRKPKGYENRALIGLSATPGRTTEDSYDNDLLSNMFGNKLISIDSDILNSINLGPLQALNTVAEENIIKYFQQRGILSKLEIEKLKYQSNFTAKELSVLTKDLEDNGYDSDFTSEQLEILATNIERNKQIMIRLKQLYKDNIPTIVFACSVKHAKMLSAMLTLDEIPNSLVTGDLSPIDRDNAINQFKDRNSNVNIIINYGVLTTGFDSTNIKCVFITRPTMSVVLYSQMIGRGLRGPQMGGNESCLLIDVDDNLKQFDNNKAFGHFDDYWK